MKVRKHNERGTMAIDWLKANYTFSFAHYYDPKHMGFLNLRVINNDFIAPEGGFPTHPHRDMEIISFIIKGELAHKDSMGNVETIKPGIIQVMSAGTGVAHSEFNPSSQNETDMMQIWIEPKEKGLKPSYGDYDFTPYFKKNELVKIVSPDKKDSIAHINQDVEIYYFEMENQVIDIEPQYSYWLQMIEGNIKVGDQQFEYRDGLSFMRETNKVSISNAKGLLFKFLNS